MLREPLDGLDVVLNGGLGVVAPLKFVQHGLATMGLVRLLGKNVAVAALPVLVVQGTITLACSEWIGPFLRAKGLENAVSATCGLLIFSVALVILQLKTIHLADVLASGW